MPTLKLAATFGGARKVIAIQFQITFRGLTKDGAKRPAAILTDTATRKPGLHHQTAINGIVFSNQPKATVKIIEIFHGFGCFYREGKIEGI
jgi:hypothetical protein